MKYAVPQLETYNGFLVVRDDLLEYGSKIRFLDDIVEKLPANELVYGSSPRWGYAQISLAYLAKKYNKKFKLFIAHSSELHDYTKRALDLGADIEFVNPGYLAVTEKRARDYADSLLADDRYLFPMGLDTPEVRKAICESALELSAASGIIPDHVWTASSSGTLHRGLSLAWTNAEFHAVSVGHKMTEQELGKAICHETKYKFQQIPKSNELPPYPSALHYEAEVWKIMNDYYVNNEKPKNVLLWNVGA